MNKQVISTVIICVFVGLMLFAATHAREYHSYSGSKYHLTIKGKVSIEQGVLHYKDNDGILSYDELRCLAKLSKIQRVIIE